MRGMFRGAAVFNQDISSFRTAKVTNMQVRSPASPSRLLSLHSIPASWCLPPLCALDLIYTHLQEMFDHARAFNRPLDNFDTAKVANMRVRTPPRTSSPLTLSPTAACPRWSARWPLGSVAEELCLDLSSTSEPRVPVCS